MQVLHSCCCGLDVHKRFVVACLIWSSEDGKQHKELRRFNTLTPDLLCLIDWLQEACCGGKFAIKGFQRATKWSILGYANMCKNPGDAPLNKSYLAGKHCFLS